MNLVIEVKDGLARWKPGPTVVEETDDPKGRCWAHLAMFTEPTIVARHISAESGSEPAPSLCQRVAHQVQQAREFFETAERSTLNTRPTLLYYGALNLVSAVYSLHTNTADSGKHGMNSEAAANLGDWAVTFRADGVIHDFAKLHGAAIAKTIGSKSSASINASLFDFLRRDPATSALLNRHAVVPSLCAHVVRVYESRTMDQANEPELNVWIFNGASSNDGRALNTFLPAMPREDAVDTSVAVVLKEKLATTDRIGQDYTVIHGRVISPSLPGQSDWWPQPLRQFATLWLLSEISRYSPEMLATSGPVGSRTVLPAIEIFMRDVIRSFPNDCLNLIYGYCQNFRPAPSERVFSPFLDEDW